MRYSKEVSDRVNFNWLNKNVINNFIKPGICIAPDMVHIKNDSIDNMCIGSPEIVYNNMIKWLNQFDNIEWISDVAHYDFVLLIDLLYKQALDIPENHSKVCHDINYDIANYYNISIDEAFNKNREEIVGDLDSIIKDFNAFYLKSIGIKLNKDNLKHNALWDALVIKAIYEKLK